MARWLGFTGTLCGGLYVFFLLGIYLHEIVGHGLVAVLLGGEFEGFSVNPGLGGWAWTQDVRAEDEWLVDWGGIAVDLATGLLGFGLFFLRPRHLSAGALALFLLALGGTARAVGYTLQGFLFLRGDAGHLAGRLDVWVRHVCIGVLLILFAALAVWALRRTLVFLEEHFEPANARQRRTAVFLSVLLPLGALILLKPQVELFEPWQRLAFQGSLAGALGVLAFFLTRRVPRDADPDAARRPSAWTGLLWFVLAGAAYAATAIWVREGVELT